MHFIEAKSILSARNGMNLYRGCSHGCIYCDARSDCYGMDHPFEDVAVKANALTLLEDALRRKRKPCMIGTGSMCDPYLHAEEELQLTRRSLEIIDRYGCGVTVLTKSTRILRDMDLYERINRHTKAVVQVTLTTADEALCRIVEPNVSTTAQRLEILRECRRRGIPTVVWLCPILPYLNDTADNLNAILDACLSCGVYGIVSFGFGVTLRAGDREYFYAKLDEHFPGMKERYVRRYGNSYECPSDNAPMLTKLFRERCRTGGIVSDPAAIFAFLEAFPSTSRQIGLFD